MTEPTEPEHRERDDEHEQSAQEIHDEMAEGHDDVTQREAFEQEMAERDRDDAGDVGDQID